MSATSWEHLLLEDRLASTYAAAFKRFGGHVPKAVVALIGRGFTALDLHKPDQAELHALQAELALIDAVRAWGESGVRHRDPAVQEALP